ncbi:MAG: rRNA adenine dimethyltransferase family protein [bacterium]
MEYKAKKSLGQNFLKSEKAVRQIVEAGELKKTDTVLEIGPGTGILTESLLKTGAKVVAIEKDRELIPLLREKFSKELENKQLLLIEGDILEIPIKNAMLEWSCFFKGTPYFSGEKSARARLPASAGPLKKQTIEKTSDVITYKLIANIPYYITGAIVRKFLEEVVQPSKIVVLVQKEVAERAVARDEKGSLLSISIKAFGEPKLVDVVKAGSFVPAPKVDSAILSISNISRSNFKNTKEEKAFFELIHLGFGHKRKTLAHNLKEGGIQSEVIARMFEESKIPSNIRAEDLHIKEWLALSRSSILK